MSRNDGGPAFPCKALEHKPGEVGNSVAIYKDCEGLSLRDYFAAKAMAVLMPLPGLVEWDKGDIAREAYYYADAMLAARGDA